jgi:hypothetical protein
MWEKRLICVVGVVLLGYLPLNLGDTQPLDTQAFAFKPAEDFTNQSPCHGLRLNNHESLFNCQSSSTPSSKVLAML